MEWDREYMVVVVVASVGPEYNYFDSFESMAAVRPGHKWFCLGPEAAAQVRRTYLNNMRL